MNKESIAQSILAFIFIGLFLAGVMIWIDLPRSGTPRLYRYQGKELMTQEEYTEFKSIVAREDVTIERLSAYSSDSPLVIFNVEVPADVEFTWGEVTYTHYKHPWRHFSNVAFVLGLISMVAVFVWWLGTREYPERERF